MRVVHIFQRDDPDTGGSLRVAEALAREQCAVGIDVWLLFLYGKPAQVAKEFGANVVCIGLESSRQAILGIGALCKAIRKIAPDVIHAHDGILWPRLAFLQMRIPVVMHSHLPARASDSRIGRFLIKKTTDCLIGISLHTIDTWVEDGYPPSRVHFVPNGVDFKRFKMEDRSHKERLREHLELPKKKRIILWVGRMHRGMKGSDRGERVARLLPPDMVLIMVGNGPEYEGIIDRCSDQIAAGNLIMVGSTNIPEEYYKAADEFLFTSYHEPFGLVILEAVASGLPMVSFPVTDGGGAVELLQEFGGVQLQDSASDSELRAALSLPLPSSKITQAYRAEAMCKYAWGPLAEKVFDIYEIALNKKT